MQEAHETPTPIEQLLDSMPTLDHLETSLRGGRLVSGLVGSLTGAPFPADARTSQIADGFVRLVERAILDYRDSQVRLFTHLRGDHNLDDWHRAQDHMESCIESLHRSIVYLSRLRSGLRNQDGSEVIPSNRELEVMRGTSRDRVRDFRGACEHLDEEIIEGRILASADVSLHFSTRGISLAGIFIQYEEIARWLSQLHGVAASFSRAEIRLDQALIQLAGPSET